MICPPVKMTESILFGLSLYKAKIEPEKRMGTLLLYRTNKAGQGYTPSGSLNCVQPVGSLIRLASMPRNHYDFIAPCRKAEKEGQSITATAVCRTSRVGSISAPFVEPAAGFDTADRQTQKKFHPIAGRKKWK
jgi:hypothetical protein